MKPNFDQMSKAELKAYVLSHRDDDEAICALFSRRNPPDSEATWYGPMSTPEGVPIEENIRIAEEAIRQRVDLTSDKQREKELQKERELEERLRQKIKQEVEARLRREIKQEQVSSRKDYMTTVTQEEIQQFREQLRDYPEAIAALDVIEECEGDLEDAAVVLAIQAGQEPNRSKKWFEELVKRCRPIVCEENFRDDLLAGLMAGTVESLAASMAIPPGLATPVVIYAVKIGVRNFCKDFRAES
jgi:polyribonucleotide nucleotidyltransferase